MLEILQHCNKGLMRRLQRFSALCISRIPLCDGIPTFVTQWLSVSQGYYSNIQLSQNTGVITFSCPFKSVVLWPSLMSVCELEETLQRTEISWLNIFTQLTASHKTPSASPHRLRLEMVKQKTMWRGGSTNFTYLHCVHREPWNKMTWGTERIKHYMAWNSIALRWEH